MSEEPKKLIWTFLTIPFYETRVNGILITRIISGVAVIGVIGALLGMIRSGINEARDYYVKKKKYLTADEMMDIMEEEPADYDFCKGQILRQIMSQELFESTRLSAIQGKYVEPKTSVQLEGGNEQSSAMKKEESGPPEQNQVAPTVAKDSVGAREAPPGYRFINITERTLTLVQESLSFADDTDVSDVYQYQCLAYSIRDKLKFYSKIKDQKRTNKKIEAINGFIGFTDGIGWFAAISQCVLIGYLLEGLLKDRVFNVFEVDQVILRAIFFLTVFFVAFNESYSIQIQQTVLCRGVVSNRRAMQGLFQVGLRYLCTYAAILVICFLLLSDPKEGEDSNVDRVKDFTALVIILELDNIIIGQMIYFFGFKTSMDIDEKHQSDVKELLQKARDEHNNGDTFTDMNEYDRHKISQCYNFVCAQLVNMSPVQFWYFFGSYIVFFLANWFVFVCMLAYSVTYILPKDD